MARSSDSFGTHDDLEEGHAFLAVRNGERTFVFDFVAGEHVLVGSSVAAKLRVDGDTVRERIVTLEWDGHQLTVRDEASDGTAFLNGKRLEGVADLKPGDELTLGPLQAVVGISVRPTVVGRRTLTHHEFRERLWEELARALRAGRTTALVMIQARSSEGGRLTSAALATLRAGDLLGAYAHDEVELLLPDANHDVARTVVERILGGAALEAQFGVAVAPLDADNPERLIRAARSALTRAVSQRTQGATPPVRAPASEVLPPVRDRATRELVTALESLAPTDSSVLLTGELSSGKGVFARLLHDQSRRSEQPYAVVSCASVSAEGDEFSPGGALHTRLAEAASGTIVLDEIGDLEGRAQSKLLALLDGAARTARVVATTHRALQGLVERGAFDARLHAHVSGAVLEVPPLRNRPDDVVPLAERFAAEFGARLPIRMSLGALARLRSYPWPGNVLELRNAMERAVRLAHGGEILAEHLPSESLPAASGEGRLREHVDSVERDAIVKALADSNHNQTHAAKRLGISRRALIYKMEKYGLKPPPGTARRIA